ncbi:type VI secretion system protein [Citrobacter portucalensis]|uniref:type VI secretion system protein n=1 Tax=Citrobacter portucalensis TaxID=1639133 RepID=UPI00226B3A72|nr:type VI secretion system protein [Citrobacter portucalensis]MCX9063287.1 type VI secretion system protein [Citrobacter portucalensis]
MFKKLACFISLLLVLFLSLVSCFVLGLWQNWSTPTVLFFWLTILLLASLMWCSLHAIRLFTDGKKGRRWLEKHRLSRQEYVLQERWRSGVNIIRRVRRQRNPLPWFLFVGDHCGKSSLLASAGVPRFYGDNNYTMVAPTRTLQWWFFRRLGILDLSSHFLQGNRQFRQGWRKLANWCIRMPSPAGIIIAVPMGSLMNGDRSELHTLARQQRTLIEPLIRHYGYRLPLHIIVTQCDNFPGFSLWQQQLSASQRQQPLGYHWKSSPDIDGQDVTILQPLFTSLRLGMSRVRLSMGSSANLTSREKITLLDFPETFTELEPSLRYTLASLCEPNAYFSHSSLSGIWFCAAEVQADNNHRRVSVFIHDLLSHHLPVLSIDKNGQHRYQRKRVKYFCIGVLTLAVLWLAISSCLSFGRLRPTLTQQTPDELSAFLAEDELYPETSLRYLPFQRLLNKQRRLAESLLVQYPSAPRPAHVVFDDYRELVSTSNPAQQRELILQLADAVLIWQQMRNDATLNTLSLKPQVASALMQRTYPGKLSPQAKLALERYYIQRPEGELWLHTAQRLLATLINLDPEFHWLIAPTPTVPDIQASSFWLSMPPSTVLDGIWTLEGNNAINEWMTQIEHALGQQQPLFQQVKTILPTLRQNAWQEYLVNITANLSSISPRSLSRSELLSIGQNQSPAMRFVSRTLAELNTVTASETQEWLNVLRQLQGISTGSSNWLSRAVDIDYSLRRSLTAWLQNQPSIAAPVGHIPSAQPLWLQWQKVRNSVVKDAVAQGTPSENLTRGFFTHSDSGEHNPLSDLFPALDTLQEKLSPQNTDPGVEAVWLLYQDDAHSLLANAMAQSVCWLNNQWKSTVIWPLGKDAGLRSYEEQQVLSQQLVSDFMRGPAKNMLQASSSGPSVVEYKGMKMPFSAEFTRLARQRFSSELVKDVPQRFSTREDEKRAAIQTKINELQLIQAEQEKKSWKLTLSSQPASIPGGARIIPTGTQLTLNCRKGDQQLSSMNFADTHEFDWQPGQCPSLTLSVIFPGFTAHYQLNGDDAWPLFIRLFSDGSTLIDSQSFSDSASTLEQMGVKQILVRFTVSDSQALESAFLEWSERANSLNELNTQLGELRQQEDSSPPGTPLSTLPTSIAQCQ